MEILSSEIVSYQNLKEGLEIKGDDFGVAALCRKSMQSAFLNNPFISDYSAPFMYLSRVNGVVGGMAMWFPTKIKIGNVIENAESSSTLEVYKDYRKLAIGADIALFPIMNGQFKFLVYAGISDQALKIYKKARFAIFEFPRAMQVRNCRSILEYYGLRGISLSWISTIVNGILQFYYRLSQIIFNSPRYEVIKESSVPFWVNEMINTDIHKYMEYHNQEWMQWNLENNFYNKTGDLQSFFSIKKEGKPIGFFMTKERYRVAAGGKLRNIIVGSIMEWGCSCNSNLTEEKIYRLAIRTFSPKVDIIEFATADESTVKKMKKFGFLKQGFAHIAVKDLTKKYKDFNDMKQWRIRFGYADVFLT